MMIDECIGAEFEWIVAGVQRSRFLQISNGVPVGGDPRKEARQAASG